MFEKLLTICFADFADTNNASIIAAMADISTMNISALAVKRGGSRHISISIWINRKSTTLTTICQRYECVRCAVSACFRAELIRALN